MAIIHPDTIPDLAPDCRRVLREAYAAIQVASDRDRFIPDRDKQLIPGPNGGQWLEPIPGHNRLRTSKEISTDVARAITEYRRVAAMWGVEVDS